MTKTENFLEIDIARVGDLWDWLAARHGQEESVWCVTWKKDTPDKYVSRDDVLDALVAHGWIDGIRRKRDDGRTMQLISPRKQQAWARSYKVRAERLGADGRMHAAGRAAVDAGKTSGLWSQSDPVDDLIVPDDLQAELGPARAVWDSFAPSYRRNVLRWVQSAKRPETRAKRVTELARRTARGEKIPNY